jgi:hypothetical protein
MSDEQDEQLEQVVIYRAERPLQAELLANLLAENGIEAIVDNDVLQAAVGEVPFGWATSVRVVVRQQDALRARQIALDFDRQLSGRGEHVQSQDSTAAEVVVDVDSWPSCPECGRRRMTSCPYCKTASAQFPTSTGPERRFDDGATILLCSTCDEPFSPIYLKVCEWCGHEFSDGALPPAPPAAQEPFELTPQLMIALAGIVAVFAGVIGYFAWLLRE